MAKRQSEPPPIEPREFRSPEEVDVAIAKLRRRIEELNHLDIQAAVLNLTGADDVAASNVRNTIREVFGPNSPEFGENRYLRIWAGQQFMDMDERTAYEVVFSRPEKICGIGWAGPAHRIL